MTNTPKPRKPIPPTSSPELDDPNESDVFKPYKLVTFPKSLPPKARPAGHGKYLSDRLHGTLHLTLKVQTPLHVSTGVVAMGSDIGSRVDLIKTMTQGCDRKLVIQGSSLKGCIRSVYEAITNSTLGVASRAVDKIPRERQPCRNKEELCPASQVFGALDWQGLIKFSDAKCENSNYDTGFMPSLYAPRTQRRNYYTSRGVAVGRKFYYNFAKSIDKGQNQGIAVQQAAKDFTFTTQIHFKNLKPAELGTLLIVLGQDPNYPIALKVGGGKPIGMGTVTVSVTAIEQAGDLRDRYSAYASTESNRLTGDKLPEFMQTQIQAAHSSLIQSPQLQQLAEVLRYPSDLQPPSGMY
jgi:CRISPR/Cas system CSM-associated protein Csm3 (group 7 of RAMP superfamily)